FKDKNGNDLRNVERKIFKEDVIYEQLTKMRGKIEDFLRGWTEVDDTKVKEAMDTYNIGHGKITQGIIDEMNSFFDVFDGENKDILEENFS
ncbi:MAG: hypothetical protein ABIE74_06445, partial [Pseudomonadota bacterium]